MIRAYNEQFMPTVREKLAAMFELAVNFEHMDIDLFASRFVQSRVCRAFEKADPVFVLGKSANELLGLILGIDPPDEESGEYASPEYWVGWVLAYSQWYLDRPYKELIGALPCRELLLRYFPYHEMDITKSVWLFSERLPRRCVLREKRKMLGLNQTELAALSGVPERTIRSYEQGKVDIAKAQAETLYALSQILGCTVEDLIRGN